MKLPPGPRKAVLSVHVIASAGWLGVHAGVLTLLAAGLAAEGAARAGELYGAAATLAGTLVLPLSLLAPASGLLCALGTPWGLFRHYWVAAKLALTLVLVVGSNIRLVPGVVALAADTEGGTVLPAYADRLSLVVALSVALAVLCAASVLSSAKPFGRIRRRRGPADSPADSTAERAGARTRAGAASP
ncbi:hypothetical protein [Streptomonospora litoralis]|uniref:DUF2269 domain-containing protein n=1 Tax=Streptomonospora litoralis TaxID=2498135 RepID=A0A4P6Q982_9ACTN|nr:hypothetical protein [Streptomonospora litoralis]QBI55744.1 hypothetical protein EKD16_19905 [Streptomonospora litoralis]